MITCLPLGPAVLVRLVFELRVVPIFSYLDCYPVWSVHEASFTWFLLLDPVPLTRLKQWSLLARGDTSIVGSFVDVCKSLSIGVFFLNCTVPSSWLRNYATSHDEVGIWVGLQKSLASHQIDTRGWYCFQHSVDGGRILRIQTAEKVCVVWQVNS